MTPPAAPEAQAPAADDCVPRLDPRKHLDALNSEGSAAPLLDSVRERGILGGAHGE